MHYGSYQSSINGEPTILTKNGSEILPWTERNKLSAMDIRAINNYYGCSWSGSNSETPTVGKID